MTVAFGDGMKQVREPNKEMMADALNEIKGSYRSMADLAKESGISPATLSRIANGNYDRPISYQVLCQLAQCAAEGCKYNLPALLEINGMQEERNAMVHGQYKDENKQGKAKTLTNLERLEISARSAIVVEIQKNSPNAFTVESDADFKRIGFIANMNYKTSGMALSFPDQGDWKWVFSVFNSYEPGTFGLDPDQKAKGFWEKLSYIFLQDAWEPESLKAYKFSAVFDDEKTFAAYVKLLEAKEFNNRFSAILINPYEFMVVREQVFKSRHFPSETSALECRGGVMGN